MPRVQKHKAGAQGKRHQSQDETESLRGHQAIAAAAAEECSSPPDSGGSPPSTPASGPSQESRKVLPTLSFSKDPLNRKASMLVLFMLEKYKKNELITWAKMIKVVKRKYKEQFLEILNRASERMELVFGLQLKEVDPYNHSYALIDILDLPSEGSLSRDRRVPKTGLLINILGMIFMKGNRTSEEELWEFLNVLGFYAGRKDALFGEPRDFMNNEFVQENYLEYRQVPDSDPPRYEFLWGPRAHAEITKMKVLQIIAKINETVPSAFPTLYEEALRDEEERAAAGAARIAKASAPSKAKSHSSSHI